MRKKISYDKLYKLATKILNDAFDDFNNEGFVDEFIVDEFNIDLFDEDKADFLSEIYGVVYKIIKKKIQAKV